MDIYHDGRTMPSCDGIEKPLAALCVEGGVLTHCERFDNRLPERARQPMALGQSTSGLGANHRFLVQVRLLCKSKRSTILIEGHMSIEFHGF